MVLRMKTFWGSLRNTTFRVVGGGGFTKNQCSGEDCLKKRGPWAVCYLRGRLVKKEGWCFSGRGGLIPQCTLCMVPENQLVQN